MLVRCSRNERRSQVVQGGLSAALVMSRRRGVLRRRRGDFHHVRFLQDPTFPSHGR